MTGGDRGDRGDRGRPAATDDKGEMDKRVDLAAAIAFLAFGGWLFRASGRIPVGSVHDSIGSGGVARVLAVFIIGASGYLVARRLLAWRSLPRRLPAQGSTDDPVAPGSAVRAFVIFGALVGYLVAVRYLGYLFATPLFVAAGLSAMRVRSPVRLAAVSLGYTVVTYALFVGLFGVLLPLGVLDRWDYYLWFHF